VGQLLHNADLAFTIGCYGDIGLDLVYWQMMGITDRCGGTVDGLCGIDIQVAPHAPAPEDEAAGIEMATDIAALMGNCVLMMHQLGGIATGAGNPGTAIPISLSPPLPYRASERITQAGYGL